jgi:hypothetical protein
MTSTATSPKTEITNNKGSMSKGMCNGLGATLQRIHATDRQESCIRAFIESVEGQNKVQKSAALVHNRYSTNKWSPESTVGV